MGTVPCFGSVALLLIMTEAVYLRPSILRGSDTLAGADYIDLHIRRISFARDALFSAWHTLPAWYPRELLGSPFAANLQNFPWIPTRLVLILLDPTLAYAVGVAIAAALAALFTYLYCRRTGLSEVGAMSAAWTFACAGFFASRVLAGHLPLLEAYPSLPLLLWLADRALSPERAEYHRLDLVALAVSSACVVVAGHPQLPAYSVATALLYVVVRGRGWRRARIIGAIALGVGTTLVAWWPMLMLIRRSTRMLDLGPPPNDIVMPYRRLLALLNPGIDGWPGWVAQSEQNPFRGYPNSAYFWDTASYIGILPLVAIMVLLVRCLAKRRLPDWPGSFLAAVGLGALICALPLVEPLRQIVPGTLFRSPARLLYLSTFSASVAFGAGVDAIRGSKLLALGAGRQAAVALCLAFQVLDLAGFARRFIQPIPRQGEAPQFQEILDREVRDGRIAADQDLEFSYADRYDDAGGFDSIFLADSYRAVLALSHLPRDLNVQRLNGAEFPLAALQATGVRFVITETTRDDLELVGTSGDVKLYRVADPAPRAAFFAERMTEPMAYFRPSSDEILIKTSGERAGFIRVLEACDPGWTADVDGTGVLVVPANGFSMAVPIPSGKHALRLRYHTPGRTLGGVLSLLSTCSLVGLIWTARGIPCPPKNTTAA